MDKRNGEKIGGEGVDLGVARGDDRGREGGFGGEGSLGAGMKNPKFDFRAEEIREDVVGRGAKFAEAKREEDLSLKERAGLAKGRIGTKWRGMLKNLRVYVFLPLFKGRRKIVSIGVMVAVVLAVGAGVWWLEQMGKNRVQSVSWEERQKRMRAIYESGGSGYRERIMEEAREAIAESRLESEQKEASMRQKLTWELRGMKMPEQSIEILEEGLDDIKDNKMRLTTYYRIWEIAGEGGLEEKKVEYEKKIIELQRAK